ncbi:MarR family winged helix-turn-helix transcriptional regulator [Maribacter sp. 2304DJ31-5]|uniref:MarR family winged helix-turn-helix transcriptional regulator n=1 Tax=Maribacter sp. 2304DJ31-5 TaxID=3386273 RepID=UPI0039BD01DA
MKIVDYHLQEAFNDHGLDLTKEQMIILKKLYEQDGINQNELATLTFRDKSSLARLLRKMEAKEYIRRIQSKEDKRNNEVFLTPKGIVLFERTRPIIQKVINVMENEISKEDKTLMISLLKKIQANFMLETTNK